MIIKVELTEPEILQAIAQFVADKTGVTVESKSLYVQVKSKQNFKSEWELAAIRVSCDVYA